MTDATQTYEKLCDYTRESALLSSIQELLEWDERTMLPPAAGPYRAEQVTYLAGLLHRRQTAPELGEWLDELMQSRLAADRHSDVGATIHELKRAYDKQRKQPQELVEALTRASVLGQQAWVQARQNDDFASFEPVLANIVRLKREQAEAVGYQEQRYDALLDDFEPGASTAEVQALLEAFRRDLVPLVAAIADSSRKPNLGVLKRHFPIPAQEAFGKQVAAAFGFDFQRGRLDITHHPFCAGLGPHDCRLTTRYDEYYFPSSFYSILHEAGHGIYDQGLRTDQFGLPPGIAVSLGIHESQSRMWENFVGRSEAFWEHYFEPARQAFPAALGDVSRETFHFAVNDVRPSLIRVEADEATYNLHIIIRFELESALIENELATADLPQAWNECYQKYLGIQPPNDADGVLQDVHWGAAAIGYFPTYAMGNLYAAQLFDAAERELGPLHEAFRTGDFQSLLQWLRQHVHVGGQCYPAAQLVERASGSALAHQPLIDYLKAKYTPLYGLD